VSDPLSIEQAQAILKAGREATNNDDPGDFGFQAMLKKAEELGVHRNWVSLFGVLDLTYVEVKAWTEGDFGWFS
jgi:hypothetical protein